MDWDALFEAFAGSLVAGVGITLAFSVGIRGLIRASELRESGREMGAGVAAAVGALALLVAVAGTTIGLLIVVGGHPLG